MPLEVNAVLSCDTCFKEKAVILRARVIPTESFDNSITTLNNMSFDLVTSYSLKEWRINPLGETLCESCREHPLVEGK